MKRSSVSARQLYATLVGPSLTLHLSCSKAIPVSHLGNKTYLIRLMNFGGVSAGMVVLHAVTVYQQIIIGGLHAGGRPLQVHPLMEARHVTVWVVSVSG